MKYLSTIIVTHDSCLFYMNRTQNDRRSESSLKWHGMSKTPSQYQGGHVSYANSDKWHKTPSTTALSQPNTGSFRTERSRFTSGADRFSNSNPFKTPTNPPNSDKWHMSESSGIPSREPSWKVINVVLLDIHAVFQ